MEKFEIVAKQIPGEVRFDNYEELKSELQKYIENNYSEVNYNERGIKVAEKDRDELKHHKDAITKAKKGLKEAYSAPYIEVEKKLEELEKLIDAPFKIAKAFVDEQEKIEKEKTIMGYAIEKAKCQTADYLR